MKTVLSVAHLLPHPEMTAGQAALALLRREGNRFIALSEHAGTSRDPEVVHDMRVACRRIRGALKDFNGFLPKWASAMDGDLKWIFGLLGHVRDFDVQMQGLREMCPDSHAKGTLLSGFDCDRRKAIGELKEALASDRFVVLISGLRRLADLSPKSLAKVGEVPLVWVAPEVMKDRFEKAKSLSKKVVGGGEMKDVHDFRKSSKRLRYSLETVQGVYGRPAQRVLKRLKKVQDAVGAYVDAEISMGHLRIALGATPFDEPARELTKDLIEMHEQRAQQAMSNLGDPWRRVDGKAWKKLKRKMKKMRKAAGKSAVAEIPAAPSHAVIA